MTNFYKQLLQLKKCYNIGKQTTNTTYTHCNFNFHLFSLDKQTTLQDLLNSMNNLEKECLKNSKQKEIIQKNGTLISKLAYAAGLKSDSKKFKYLNIGTTYSQ